MDTLITARGKNLKCDYFNLFPPAGQINLRIIGEGLTNVAAVFGDPTETVQLYWGKEYLAHYTRLIAIVPEGDAIRVVLEKEI